MKIILTLANEEEKGSFNHSQGRDLGGESQHTCQTLSGWKKSLFGLGLIIITMQLPDNQRRLRQKEI